ncbi:AAA family ATPase [Flavobacterium azooxidireducens]|uniref:AAA family ATPase n=1 Tax=Flavobacterium azooxidireducens TaxID=1871076 RepID=A0ABY4KJQ3_9FLAO|nr:AAA family ATPase [Flavobacterium azooxidireducens]UPQ79642.1 AAA family ATPase [Flavobacterium azooxidireducens]
MKINYKSDYISIKSFSPIEINDFSILTGKNGSGKTHFLSALKKGHIEIQGIDKSEIVYYNYNDFTVFSGNIQQNPQYQNRLNEWNNEKQQYLNKIKSYKTKVIKLEAEQRTLTENIIYKHAKNPNFDFDSYFGKEGDFEILKQLIGVPNLSLELMKKRKLLSPSFFQFVHEYLNKAKGKIEDLSYEKLKPVFNEVVKLYSSSIDERIKNEDEDLYTFLTNTFPDKDISKINANDFESPNLFLEDIVNEEKEYQLKKTENIINKAKALDYKEQVTFLEADEFIKVNGLSPIEQINGVLAEYDCNGYYLYSDANQKFLGVDKNNIKIPVSLQHKEKKYTTNFDQLSSGEKTLIALSIFIHKTRKKRIIPRVLLLDEVDSSLHPSMINRLLDVIQNLFVKEQKFKVILATHSPTTVALSPEDSVFIIETNGEHIIRKECKEKIVNILTEGIATINVEDTKIGINYNISKTELPILFTEGITDKIILETAWSKLYGNEMPFFIQDCFDASFLGNLFRRAEDAQDGIFVNYSDKIFIALFDFDQEGYNVWNGLKKKYTMIEDNPKKALTIKHKSLNAYAILLPVPENKEIINQVIKSENLTYENESILTIELLFYGIESLEQYFRKNKIKGGGEIIEFKGKKRDFANSLIALNKDDFKHLIPIFEKVNEIINSNA